VFSWTACETIMVERKKERRREREKDISKTKIKTTAVLD
jgi:hypothetical protein